MIETIKTITIDLVSKGVPSVVDVMEELLNIFRGFTAVRTAAIFWSENKEYD